MKPRLRRPSKYKLLLASLVLFILMPLLFGEGPLLRLLYGGALLAVVITVLRELSHRRRVHRLGLILGMGALIGEITSHFVTRWKFLALQPILLLAFLGFVGIVILRNIVVEEKITGDEIRGAICVYLFIGGGWAAIYGLLHLIEPGSFSFAHAAADSLGPTALERGTALYFSFVTLTTLGYGDITPLTRLARTLCWMEAAVGQIFLAVLIARLVGLHIAHSNSRNPQE